MGRLFGVVRPWEEYLVVCPLQDKVGSVCVEISGGVYIGDPGFRLANSMLGKAVF